jgi:hypothetical protein
MLNQNQKMLKSTLYTRKLNSQQYMHRSGCNSTRVFPTTPRIIILDQLLDSNSGCGLYHILHPVRLRATFWNYHTPNHVQKKKKKKREEEEEEEKGEERGRRITLRPA